jgi:drug/metabolite transporter (DMT)-like permease
VLYAGGLALYPKMYCTNEIEASERNSTQYKFVMMGLLDCFGTFLSAMGAVYTPGSTQALLNQTLLPMIMLGSRAFLGRSFSTWQLLGAIFIICGAMVVVAPAFVASCDTPANSRLSANLIYLSSNVPMVRAADLCIHTCTAMRYTGSFGGVQRA